MKTVIIYATKYGSAKKAAEKLKNKLSGDPLLINIDQDAVPPLAPFDTVVLGSSIYFGKINKQLTQYISRHESELLTKRLGLFICGGIPNEEELKKELENAFPSTLHEHATVETNFGYEINYDQLKLYERFIMKVIAKTKENTSNLSADAIERFATRLMSSSTE